MEYLTEQDLSSYFKEMENKLGKDELKHEIDIPPKDIEERNKGKIDQKQIDSLVHADLIKSVTVSEVFRHVEIPDEIYLPYLKNEDGAKEKLIEYVKKQGKEPEINVYVQKDITNK
jgi:hypothetical protein